MESVLKLSNVSKWFGKKKIINNISFEVKSGEVFGFLGPNGAGKTTTIKMILGFISICEGDILINGYNTRKDFEKAMAKVGGIVENPEMYNYLSGLINLKMYARLHNGVTKERINEVVNIVGMQNRINEKMKKYSLGMKQRCGLAQSILHKPKLLILDEPTNGLDPSGIKELRDILKDLAHKENVAVFISSHLLSEMELMCDKVAIINNGELMGVKTVTDIIAESSDKIINRFLVKPVDKALEILRPKYNDIIKETSAEYIDIEVDGEKVSEITVLLAKNGIGILGVQKKETSFEEAFINITGGGNNIA